MDDVLRLDRLESVQEIKQLPLRYAYYVDSRNLDAFFELWDDHEERTPFPGLDIHSFREGQDRFFKSSVASIHLVANHLVWLSASEPDRASGVVYSWVQTDRHGTWVRQMVLYEDEYVRRNGVWLFDHRRHLLWYGEKADANPRQQDPMDWPHGDLQGSGSFGRGSLPEDFPTYRAYWGLDGATDADGRATLNPARSAV